MAGNSRPTGDGETTGPTDVIRPVDTVYEGRRSHRPWLVAVVSAAAVAGMLVGGLTLANRAPAGASPLPAVAAAAALSATEPQSPTTAAAIVYRLQQLLPAGQTSGFAGSPMLGQIYLDQGHGPGMVRLSIATGVHPRSNCTPSSGTQISCEHLSDGSQAVVVRNPRNCVQSLSVDVIHPNGVAVQASVASCLAWNGTTNPAGRPALTQDEAIRIADDPSWGPTMSSALVAAAAQKFPNLPPVS